MRVSLCLPRLLDDRSDLRIDTRKEVLSRLDGLPPNRP
jgi:hypothetical protein